MKCPKCEGKGFIEFEHGLVMLECDECGGTKEVDNDDDGNQQSNSNPGGGDTSQPELKPKLKAKKKATRGAK